MAKLHSYYVLCPLIDQKSFLGVSYDKDRENVLVTLGRNVVNKYRLSDQKQVGGWTSKDHITSEVIFDMEEDTYIGVFNKNTIKKWTEDSDNLDKLKKYKFAINILKILKRHKQPPLIIFSNGNCASLPYAVDNQKTYEGKPILKDNEEIVNTGCFNLNKTDHIVYIVKYNNTYEIVTCPIRDEIGDLDKSKVCRVKIDHRPEDVYVVGKLILAGYNPAVIILWSDSKMTMYNIIDKCWTNLGTVPWISTCSSVSLCWMAKHYVILFGSNKDQDGAFIVVYDIKLSIGSCKYPMKMYSEEAKLYCINDYIILEASNHIGMLPYVLETTRNLSNLLGSHEIVEDECTEFADWGTSTELELPCVKETSVLFKLGLTERSICSNILPLLVQKNNFSKTVHVLKELKDVPETVLVLLLRYAIRQIDPFNIDISDQEALRDYLSNMKEGNIKLAFLHRIFKLPFSDALLIPHLRNGLDVKEVMFLMSFIAHELTATDKTIPIDYESKLYDWCTLFLDAFYQQFLMTKEDVVTRVLKNTLDVVTKLTNHLIKIDNLLPLLNKIKSGKITENPEEMLSYTIEMMEI